VRVEEFLKATEMNAHQLAMLAGLSYKVVADAKDGATVGLKAAEKLAAVRLDGHDARMTIADLIGLGADGRIHPRKPKRKRAA
jgi:hypothetical protein